MRMLILGASGRTGQAVVAEAAARGHSVTTFERRPNASTSALVAQRIGDPRSSKDLVGALEGQEAVISCLG